MYSLFSSILWGDLKMNLGQMCDINKDCVYVGKHWRELLENA